MGLLIYKASAGSGKTFTLAVEYIKHLIQNPRAYRQILAVTFTNKATAEMKERIMQQLNGIRLNDPDSKNYANEVLRGLRELPDGGHWTMEKVREQAGIALHYMLHDYGRFRVETIDSFFQSVMRNLARELEQSPNLNIELNADEVVADAVESMMEKLTLTSPLLKWLLDYIQDRIENNQKWNTTKELKDFAKNIFNEEFIEQGQKLREELKELDRMKQFISLLQAMEKEAKEILPKQGEKFFKILEEHGLKMDDLAGKSRSVGAYFIKLQDGNISNKIAETKAVVEGLVSVDAWVKENHKKYKMISNLVKETLMPMLNETEKLRQDCVKTINSCRKSLKNLHELQLLNYISQEVKTLNSERNRFLLSDTTALLHNLIKEDDSSFIFEKLGTQISNIMIDEFQDTSRMQWDNFRLLLLEGLSQGAESLIVGDVKQSIYRWRNGDWSILNNLGRKEHPTGTPLDKYPITVKTLKVNRRSEKNIIDFNNRLFQALVKLLEEKRKQDLKEECPELVNAYADVEQDSSKDVAEGFVKVIFPDKEEGKSRTEVQLESVANEVKRLMNQGIQPEQMTILVRKKKHISPIANYLYQQLGVVVVSDEAFRLDASPAINLLIDALRFVADNNDHIALSNLASSYCQQVLQTAFDEEQLRKEPIKLLPEALETERQQLAFMPLYELLEELYRLLDINKIANQESYLFAFFDHTLEYLQKEPADINRFLQHWDEVLCSKTIQSGSAKGIRAYTIHKSKGLQFHTVLLPYCDWKMENEVNGHLTWCVPQVEPYNAYSLLPIEYDSSMAESIYRNDYRKEQLQLWVDNLNTLYVALTRAEKNLLIWGGEAKNGRIDSLIDAALGSDGIKALGGTWLNGIYELGELYNKQKEEKKEKKEEKKIENRLTIKAQKLPVKMEGLRHRIDFKQSNESSLFISGKSEEQSWRRFINRGNLLHFIFSKIGTKEEANEVIEQLIADGTITKEMEAEVRQLVTEALAFPQVGSWYDGSWKLLNERDIIWMDKGKLCNKRPDRVMIKGDEVVVVDFKFGEPRKSHHKQVKIYLELLQKMGYPAANLSGYLWYVENGETEKIKN